MADYQTNRAAFVQSEYRYKEAPSEAVKTRNPDTAREITIETNLDEATATALSAKYLAANSRPRAFEVVLEGVMFLDDYVGGSPSFIPNFPEHATDGRTMRIMGYTTDADSNRTTVSIRG